MKIYSTLGFVDTQCPPLPPRCSPPAPEQLVRHTYCIGSPHATQRTSIPVQHHLCANLVIVRPTPGGRLALGPQLRSRPLLEGTSVALRVPAPEASAPPETILTFWPPPRRLRAKTETMALGGMGVIPCWGNSPAVALSNVDGEKQRRPLPQGPDHHAISFRRRGVEQHALCRHWRIRPCAQDRSGGTNPRGQGQ